MTDSIPTRRCSDLGRVADEGVPAVAPDGVLALPGIAVGLVAAGVNDLEVVDVAVGLVEVAVAVVVVAIVHVVAGELGRDVGVVAPGGELDRKSTRLNSSH